MVQRNESQGDPVKLEEPIEPDSSRASAPCAPSGKAQDGAESSSGLAELLANTAGELHVAAQSLIEVYSDRVKQRVAPRRSRPCAASAAHSPPGRAVAHGSATSRAACSRWRSRREPSRSTYDCPRGTSSRD